MMKRAFVISTVYFGLLVVTNISGASQEGREQEARQDQQAARLMELIPSDTVSNAEVFETNGFHVKSSHNKELNADLTPSGNQFEGLIVEADDVFKVAISKGRPMSSGGAIGVYHRSLGTPILAAADRDGDGRVDILTYSVLNEGGEAIRDVIDYGADGQADLRIHFDQDLAEIWHLERWYPIEKRDGARGIMIEGKFTKVRSIDNRLIIQ